MTGDARRRWRRLDPWGRALLAGAALSLLGDALTASAPHHRGTWHFWLGCTLAALGIAVVVVSGWLAARQE